MKGRTLSIISLGILTAFSSAYATLPKYADVAAVIKKPVDDAPVVFQGYIIRKLDSSTFVFSDGTADIKIQVDREVYPDVKVDPMVRVEIRGEVEKDEIDEVEIDVGGMTVLGE
ncbi:YgiW/YdeI family stress tolerance OB fold protein [Seleniivibrio woodruffii]|uniref:Uncharacterized protein (TIGR00156 family) n=1 Tax=Seleniivibrio woodruffii TaxID=1078050 RepID=A0A4R1KC52_9BACT|nr:NirD/YgiW/YdeI family stress tolerance protein [Seleniivibrio woodruffii]TCK62054.1 uncharacterized protein (TIGR00156 family) [Seleniivibrio woodruffii]TVZ34829.1 uncharacterized protein (TIGR00156 family) [Seleniivibrio woodruffii]